MPTCPLCQSPLAQFGCTVKPDGQSGTCAKPGTVNRNWVQHAPRPKA